MQDQQQQHGNQGRGTRTADAQADGSAICVAVADSKAHTPGPWVVAFVRISEADGIDALAVNGARPQPGYPGSMVCAVAPLNKLTPEDTANALLIAAAPDMLAALVAAEKLAWEVGTETDDGVNTLLPDSRGDLWRQISAVIARATGAAS